MKIRWDLIKFTSEQKSKIVRVMSVNPKYKSLLALFMGKVPLRDSTSPLKISAIQRKNLLQNNYQTRLY